MLFSLQDPAVTDVAIAALNGLKMGDKTLSVRRASARFVFWCWLFVSLVSIAFVTILFKLEEMDNCAAPIYAFVTSAAFSQFWNVTKMMWMVISSIHDQQILKWLLHEMG
jgi:hypothetical protein